VVECHDQVRFLECIFLIHHHSQELSVVDHSVVVQVSLVKDLRDLLVGDAVLRKSLLDFCKAQYACVVEVERTEFIA